MQVRCHGTVPAKFIICPERAKTIYTMILKKEFKYLGAGALICALGLLPMDAVAKKNSKAGDDGVKTTFQTSREWRPTIDNRADAVMVYGVGGNPSDSKRGNRLSRIV